MVTVKVLGTGCKKCLTLEAKVKEIVSQNNINAVVAKVTDIQELMNYGIMMTPGLVVNEQVKRFGVIHKDDQILKWLKEN
ncbi:thioredoxin family protein [Ignavibacterium sp.]|uniref:thioredoxin family protein n=1 Tax=Ignavibacterium sp. TaxID=2651167 RepID=UPI00307CF5D2